MASSLRRTLAIRFSATMAVALLGIGLWTYRGVQRTLREQLDTSLDNSFDDHSVRLARFGRLPDGESWMTEDRFVRGVGRLIVLRDSTGHIVQANTRLAFDLALDTADVRRALTGTRSAGHQSWRGACRPLASGPAPSGVPAGVLQVAAAMRPLKSASRTLFYGMLTMALLGALASLVGAGWLARSALRPVADIARQAGAMQGPVAGQRIAVYSDVAELRGLIEMLNRMLERLERVHEWHRRIIRDLAHDLRTPITTMRAGVEMALWRERQPDEYRDVLATTLEEIDRLMLIGDALSLLGRLESGDFEPAFGTTDLRLLVSQAVDRTRDRGGAHDLRYDPPPQPVTGSVDVRLMGMALDQLLDNARRHTPPGTAVAVGLATVDNRVLLTVEDQGPGVSDEMLPHLFDRFYRGDAARGRQAGPGLGLTVAAAIADIHRGRIAAERGAMGGLRVTIDLPGGTDAG